MSTATELLNLALRRLESYEEECGANVVDMEVMEEIRAFLAAEPEADKPMAWMHPVAGVIQTRLTGLERDTYTIPLYTRPEPARKLLSDVEIADEFGVARNGTYFMEGVFAGVRWAEKHHGIGGDDGNLVQEV